MRGLPLILRRRDRGVVELGLAIDLQQVLAPGGRTHAGERQRHGHGEGGQASFHRSGFRLRAMAALVRSCRVAVLDLPRLVGLHRRIDVERPRVHAAAQVVHIAESGSGEERRRVLAPAAVMADQHERASRGSSATRRAISPSGIDTEPSMRHSSSSHGSRTSTTSGAARAASARQRASSAADELRDQNSKCAGAAALIRAAGSRSRTGRSRRSAPGAVQRTSRARHRRRFADDANTRPPGLSCSQERFGQHRRRAGEHDRVVGLAAPSARAVADAQLDVAEAGRAELRRALARERRDRSRRSSRRAPRLASSAVK